MSLIPIFISTTTFGRGSSEPLEMLRAAGFQYELNPFGRKLNTDETIRLLKGKAGVIAGTEIYSADVLEQLDELKVISRCGTGIDGIDLEALQKRNIKLLRTENAHVKAVAELTAAAILALCRQLPGHFAEMKNKKWERNIGRDLSGSVLGIVGLGKIGIQVAHTLREFGCSIVGFDPYCVLPPPFVQMYDDEEAFWKQADIITIHVPLTDQTRGWINSRVFKLLKNDVILINTSRGGIIHEGDLLNFLRSHPQAMAYLDVFSQEPYAGELLDCPNLYATPHIGTFTYQTRLRMEIEAVQNLITFFKHTNK